MILDIISQTLGYDIEELQQNFSLLELSQMLYNFNVKHNDKIYLRKNCKIFDSKCCSTIVSPSFEFPINDCTFIKNNSTFTDSFDTNILVIVGSIPVEDKLCFLHTNKYLYNLRSSITYYLIQNKIYNKIFVFLKDSIFYYIPKVQLSDGFALIQTLKDQEHEDLQTFIKNKIIEIDNKVKNRL